MYLSKNIRKLRYEKYRKEDYELLEKDLSDKKFLQLKENNRRADSSASTFHFDELLENSDDFEEI